MNGRNGKKLNRRAIFMLALGSAVSGAARSSRARADDAAAAPPTSANVASAPRLQNLKAAGPECQVVAIRHHGDSLEVVTADGRSKTFYDIDLRIKIDASHNGPLAGRPVILPGGMLGDRVTLFFASPAEISDFISSLA